MPISPANFPALQPLSNGEYATSVVFNRPHFNMATRTDSLKALLEAVESEVVTARDSYASLDARLDDMFGDSFSDRNIKLVGDDVSWNAPIFAYDQITLVQPDKTFNYTINSGSMGSISDGDSLYVTLSRDPLSTTLTLTKAASGAVPEGKDIFVIAVRAGTRMWIRGSGNLDEGESRSLGDGTTDVVLGRLGMTSDTDNASHFTSTIIVDSTDNIPEAISKLDEGEMNLIEDRNSLFVSSANVEWDASGGELTWDANIVIRVPNIGDVSIASGSLTGITSNRIVYITLDRAQTGNYSTTFSSCDLGSLPLSNGNTDNFVIGFRYSDKFVFRTGDVLQDGETKQIGLGGGGLKVDQDRLMFFSSDTDVIWDATAGEITGGGSIMIHFPWRDGGGNEIPPTEFPITLSASGKKAYVILDRDSDGTVGVIDDVDEVPLSYSQTEALLVAQRVGDAVYIFGQRWNDLDRKRIGEGFVAGDIYDAWYEVSNVVGEASVTLPGGQTYVQDGKTLQIDVNGVTLEITRDYTESSTTQITAATCELFPDGKFPYRARVHFRIDSIVTGGAGPGFIGGGSESTTVSNIGSGSGIYKEIVGTDIRLKSIKAGSNIVVTENSNELEISASTSGEANTASNLGTGSSVYKQKVGVDLQFRKIKAGTNVTVTENANDIEIASTGGGTGETNTASNLGAGEGVYAQKVGVDLQLKSLKAGTNITLTSSGTEIEISASGSGSGVGEDFVVRLGAGSSVADKVSAAPGGGIPSGWSIVDGTHGSVDAELSGSADDLVLIHGLTKVSILQNVTRGGAFFGGGGFQNVDFTSSGDVLTNTLKTQTKIVSGNADIGNNTSYIFLKFY